MITRSLLVASHAAAFSLMLCLPVKAGTHIWQTGKVLDSNVTRDLGTTSANSVSNMTQSSAVTVTHMHQSVFWDKQFVIEGGDYIYTVDDLSQKAVGVPTHGIVSRAIANRKHGCRVVIGDPIQYAPEKDKMFISDADGKKCKLDIVRQERPANKSISQ